VTGALTASSTLGVSGVATFDSSITANDPVTITSTLEVDDTVQLDSTVTINDDATITGTLGVTGALTASSTLGVTGIATLDSSLVADNINWGGTDAGGDDAYVVTMASAPGQYVTGMLVSFLADDTSKGACSVNVNSLGIKSIKTQAGADPDTAYILPTSAVVVIYDGTNFVLVSPDAAP